MGRIGLTPLGTCRLSSAEILCSNLDVDVNLGRSFWMRPLVRAIRKRNTPVVNLLLSRADLEINCRDAQTGERPLLIAARSGMREIVEAMCHLPSSEIDIADHDGYTPLLYAFLRADGTMMRTLAGVHQDLPMPVDVWRIIAENNALSGLKEFKRHEIELAAYLFWAPQARFDGDRHGDCATACSLLINTGPHLVQHRDAVGLLSEVEAGKICAIGNHGATCTECGKVLLLH